MREKLDEIIYNLKTKTAELNEKLSKQTKILILAIAVGVLVIAFAIAMLLNSASWGVLYTGLDEQEVVQIVKLLEDQKIKYKVDGSVISVPKENVNKVKASLASAGYPKTGFTYDLFKDNVNLLATDFEKYKYAQFELESRMAETIKQFEGVKNATVAIAMAQEQKYVLQEDVKESSASVTVTMQDGGSPTREQVKGIQRLVARGVPGLKIENVSVLNGEGEEVTEQYDNPLEGSNVLKIKVKKQLESDVKAKVLNVLQPLFGQDNVRVSVNCAVDMDKKIKEIIEYIPSENNRGVLHSANSAYEVQGNGKITAGVPGTETNADIPVYPGVTTDGNDVYFKDDRALEYLVSQVKEQIESDTGEITDTTISVAVDSADLTPKKAGELRQTVALAAGIDVSQADTKIAIFNAPFFTESKQPAVGFAALFESNPMLKYIIPAILALIIALVVIIIVTINKAKARKRAEELAAEEARRLTDSDTLISLDELEKSREDELKSQIQDFTDMNPEISALLLKTWLRGEEGINE